MSAAAKIWSKDGRRLAALVLHFLACLCFAETGLAGRFAPAQALAGLFIAFIVMSTLCWQWKLFGSPWRPLDFTGHLGVFCSVFFLVGRLYTKNPEVNTLLDALSSAVKWGAGLIGGIPPQVFDVLSSPGIAVLFLALCVALSLPRGPGIGTLVSIAFVTIALTATSPTFSNPQTLLFGTLLFGIALWFQHDDPEEREYWGRVLRHWEHDRALRGDLELKVRLLRRIRDAGRPMSEQECLAVVAQALECEPADPRAQQALVRVVAQLVQQDGLGAVYSGPEGKALAAREAQSEPTDTFTFIAGIPKLVIMGIITVVWVVSPIDLIPDSTPFIGNLDDIAVTLFTAMAAWQGLKRPPPRLPPRSVL